MNILFFKDKEEIAKHLLQNTGLHYIIDNEITYTIHGETEQKKSNDFYFVKTQKEQCKTCKLFITCVNFCDMKQYNYFILQDCKKFKIEGE